MGWNPTNGNVETEESCEGVYAELVVTESGDLIEEGLERYITPAAAAKKIGISLAGLRQLQECCRFVETGTNLEGMISEWTIFAITNYYLPAFLRDMKQKWANEMEAEQILGLQFYREACRRSDKVEKCKRFGHCFYNREDLLKFRDERSAGKVSSKRKVKTRVKPQVAVVNEVGHVPVVRPKRDIPLSSSLDWLRNELIARQHELLMKLQRQRELEEEARLIKILPTVCYLATKRDYHRNYFRKMKNGLRNRKRYLERKAVLVARRVAGKVFVREVVLMWLADRAGQYLVARSNALGQLVSTMEVIVRQYDEARSLAIGQLISTLMTLKVEERPKPWLDRSEKPCQVVATFAEVKDRVVDVEMARSLIEGDCVADQLVTCVTAGLLIGDDAKTISQWAVFRQIETVQIVEFKSRSRLVALRAIVPWLESDYCRFLRYGYTEIGEIVGRMLIQEFGREVRPISRQTIRHWVRDDWIENVLGPGGQCYISANQLDKALKFGRRSQGFIFNTKK